MAKDDNFAVLAIVCGVVMLAGMLCGSCVGCTRAQADACRAVMTGGTEAAKLVATAQGGVCHEVGR